jgi:hypothetical protein
VHRRFTRDPTHLIGNEIETVPDRLRPGFARGDP